MSLLMDALRKAEEAKRRAAQESDIESTAAPASPAPAGLESFPASTSTPEVASSGDSHHTESESAAEQDFTLSFDDLPASSASSVPAAASLDIALDFNLDETVTSSPSKETAPSFSPTVYEVPELPQPDANSVDFSSLKLIDNAQDTGNSPEPTLLLDEPESVGNANELIYQVSQHVHKAAPDDIKLAATTANNAEPERSAAAPAMDSEIPAMMTTEPPTASVGSEGVKQSAAAIKTAEGTEKSEKTAAAVGTLADKLAGRKSARAVFAAKAGKGAAGNKRVIILSSVAVFIAIAAAGGWIVLSGLLNPGAQYNIPASVQQASFDNQLPLITPESTDANGDTMTSAPAEAATDDLIVSASDTDASITEAATLAEVAQPAARLEQVAAAPTTTETVSQTISSPPTPPVEAISPVPNSSATPAEQATALTTFEAGPLSTAQSASPIQISRSQPMRNPDMQMLTAWSAYQQGDFVAARILYQQSLAINPDNRDALLGVAASAMQQGDMASARQTYARLLSMNPRDPLARTGMLETTTSGDPTQRESDLKALLSDHPDLAAISYALGNLYASQQRWHEAQQAYYNALLSARTQASGPVSPDYAFNLAISLERINQPQAALNFYREAKVLSNDHTGGFDMAVLEQRLQALERVQP